MPISNDKLKAVLLSQNLIQEKALKSIIENAEAKGKSLEDMLFERGAIPEEKLSALISQLYEVEHVRLAEKTIIEPLLRIVPYTLAANQFVIPFDKNTNEVCVAMKDPKNDELINSIEKKTGLKVKPYYATEKEIKTALKAYNRNVNEKFTKLLKGALEDPTKIESLKDAAKILDTIILFAYQNNASDIHIEPHRDFIATRYRIDGILQTITELPMQILDLLITRIKVLSNLRTDEHRAAQDGRFKIDLENNEITLRVSILPTYDGEKAVLRILSSTNQELNLESLGYSKKNLKAIDRNILKTHGIILMTGPTGSGKTTTLYSVLKLLNSSEVNISTIEDPIEYRLEGINQIQVNPKTNLTFAAGLRSLLRQDPDIIMVGEIRDEETGGIAVNAALTGHLVLATLHTNDAATTLPRMQEMGIEGFLLSATVKMVIAQRLVRKICSKCKETFTVNREELKALGAKYNFEEDFQKIFEELIKTNPELAQKLSGDTIELSRGKGCSACADSGFKGRTCISEVLEISDEIKKMILKNESPKNIEEQAKKEGMTTIFMDGITKVIEGNTTIEEVLRVMRS
jgi:type IV pilus assembly protein PilB